MKVPIITQDVIDRVVAQDGEADANRFQREQPQLIALADRVFADLQPYADQRKAGYLAGMTIAWRCFEEIASKLYVQ